MEQAVQIDKDTLHLVVQKVLRNSAAKVTEWKVNKVYGGGGSISCVYRLEGKAQYHTRNANWSVILKTLQTNGSNERSWNYWKREALVYQSGVFNKLEKVQLPECYFVEEQTKEGNHIWLQDLNLSHRSFSSHDFENVAYELGKMNGLFLHADAQEKDSYLSNNWLDGYVESALPGLELLQGGLSNPYVDKLFHGNTRQKLDDLWQERDSMLKRIKSLPQTLCHLDAVSKNIFLSKQTQDIVLIDWAYTGKGALGQDLAALIVGSVLLYDGDLSWLDELERSVVPIYLAGLRDVGWQGEEFVPLAGLYLAIALRYSLYGVVRLPILLDEKLHSWVEKTVGHPLADYVERVSCIQDFALERIWKANKLFLKNS